MKARGSMTMKQLAKDLRKRLAPDDGGKRMPFSVAVAMPTERCSPATSSKPNGKQASAKKAAQN